MRVVELVAAVAAGTVVFFCFVLLDKSGALSANAMPLSACTDAFAARDFELFGLPVPSSLQRTFIFGLLFCFLLYGVVWSRLFASRVEGFLATPIRWSRSGGHNLRPENLWQSLKTRFFNWCDESLGPLLTLLNVGIFGFLAPFVGFFLVAYLWTWLFPGLVLRIDGADETARCVRAPQLLQFLWEHFWRGTTLNLPDALGWRGPQLTTNEGHIAADVFVMSFRLYLFWAGALSLAQTAGQLLNRQAKSLLDVLSIPILRVWRRLVASLSWRVRATP